MALSDPSGINACGVVEQEAVLVILITLYEKYVKLLNETTCTIFEILNCDPANSICRRDFLMLVGAVNPKCCSEVGAKEQYLFEDILDVLEERRLINLYQVKNFVKTANASGRTPDFDELSREAAELNTDDAGYWTFKTTSLFW